jgi:hypothetical protein
VDIPNQPAGITGGQLPGGPFCRIVTSWAHLADFRLRGSVPIKGGFSASAIYRNTPGAEESALMTVTSKDVQFVDPSRTALTTSQTVYLYAPNSVYGPRFQQLDVAVNKTFNLGWSRLRAAFDVYNVLNSNSVQNVNTTYGSSWLKPTTFLDARLARITASLEF